MMHAYMRTYACTWPAAVYSPGRNQGILCKVDLGWAVKFILGGRVWVWITDRIQFNQTSRVYNVDELEDSTQLRSCVESLSSILGFVSKRPPYLV